MAVTPTQLRENLYKILDQVIETQVPVDILRKGHIVKLMVGPSKISRKLSTLKAHPEALCVDPDLFIETDWSINWQKGMDL